MGKDEPTVELIMVTWNTKELIQKTIPNIVQSTTYPKFHLTIIDNSSYDGTWQEIKTLCYEFPQHLDAYQTHINKGYGTACNIGAKLTQPDYYIFLNSDIYVKKDNEDWIEQLLQTFKDEEDVGVVAPKLINQEGIVVGHAVLGDNRNNLMDWYWQKPDGEEFDDMLDAVTLCGAAIMIPRELYEDMGGFDEVFFHYYEEKDLIYRLRKEGYRAICNPKSVLVHDHMGSSSDSNMLMVYEFEGRALFMEKHKDFMNDPTRFER